MEALELLVIHLLEEISVPGGANNVNAHRHESAFANQPDFIPFSPPPVPKIPARAERSFQGSITSLELLRDVKTALLSRVDTEQQEQFKKEIKEINEKLKKLKGEE